MNFAAEYKINVFLLLNANFTVAQSVDNLLDALFPM